VFYIKLEVFGGVLNVSGVVLVKMCSDKNTKKLKKTPFLVYVFF